MKMRKGAALPGAVALCSILLIVSVAVAGTVVSIVSTNLARRTKSANELEFLNSHEQFVNNDGDPSAITGTKYTYRVYDFDEIPGKEIKALVAYVKDTETIKYYSIYDFTNYETLAYQTNNLYIYNDENYIYLGGLVKIDRS